MNTEKVMEVLRQVEWAGAVPWREVAVAVYPPGGPGQCPQCGGWESEGHYDGCELAALLSEGEKEKARKDKMNIAVAEDYEYTSGLDDSISFESQKTIGKGFCFHCDRPVEIEYDEWWLGDYAPPKTCLECGGHDIEFMSRAVKRLWECIETLDEWPELVRFISIPRQGVCL